jgi:Rap1a immunity proteins
MLVAACIAMLSVHDTVPEENTIRAKYIMPGCRALLEPDAPKHMNAQFLSSECGAIISRLVYASSSNICPPKHKETREDVRVVVKYIDDQPARLHEPFLTLVLEALRAAWPCK